VPLSHLWRAPADAVEERVEGFGSRRRHENDLLHQHETLVVVLDDALALLVSGHDHERIRR